MTIQPAVRLLLATILVVLTAGAQIDTEIIPPAQDLRDLYERAAASRLVIVGTVVKSEGVAKRLSQSDKDKMIQPGPEKGTFIVSLDGVVGGSLFTIQIEDTVCRQADFEADTNAPPKAQSTVQLFLPHDERSWINGHRQEILLTGTRYLVFLVEPAHEIQKDWTSEFDLDPNQTYYRGEELNRGIIPLDQTVSGPGAPPQSAVLDKTTRLCQAFRPPRLADKLAALRKLVASGDPVLRKEAKQGLKHLQSMQH